MKRNERIKYVDLAKTIGIIAVLYSHAGMGSRWIVPYYMPMFAALSGCTYQYCRRDSWYCLKAVRRLIKQYFTYSLVVMILYVPLAIIERRDLFRFYLWEVLGVLYSRKSYLFPYNGDRNVLMQMGNGPMWFVTFLSCSYLLFLLIEYIHKRYQKKGLIAILMIYCIDLFLLSKVTVLFPWSIDTSFIGAIFIWLGKNIEYIKEKCDASESIIIKRYYICFVTIVAAIVYGLIVMKIDINWNLSVRSYETSISNNPYTFMFICAVGLIMFLGICIIISEFYGFFLIQYIGKRTLPILCLHAVVYM